MSYSPAIALENIPPITETLQESSPCSEAEGALLRRGFCFQVTRRIDLRLWARWKASVYRYFCREARPALRVPPVGPIWRGVITSFAYADSECKHADDQLHVIPFGWTYSGDELHADIVCRPRDESDATNYERLKALFGTPAADVETRLQKAEEHVATYHAAMHEATSLMLRTMESVQSEDG